MATLTRKFIWHDGKKNDHGLEGWFPIGLEDDEHFLPNTGGAGLAHDTLEHFKLDGTVTDEMMALGSLFYIRGETGRMRERGSFFTLSENFADLMHSVYEETRYADFDTKDRIRKPVAEMECLEAEMPEIEKAFMLKVERNDSDVDFSTDEPFRSFTADWFRTASYWLMRGYLKAQRRWQRGSITGYGAEEACDMFWHLSKVLEDHKNEETCPEGRGGNLLTIHCNLKRRSFNIVRGFAK